MSSSENATKNENMTQSDVSLCYESMTRTSLRMIILQNRHGAFLIWLDLRAKLIIDDHWDAVGRIAIGLLKRGTLAHEEIALLV